MSQICTWKSSCVTARGKLPAVQQIQPVPSGGQDLGGQEVPFVLFRGEKTFCPVTGMGYPLSCLGDTFIYRGRTTGIVLPVLSGGDPLSWLRGSPFPVWRAVGVSLSSQGTSDTIYPVWVGTRSPRQDQGILPPVYRQTPVKALLFILCTRQVMMRNTTKKGFACSLLSYKLLEYVVLPSQKINQFINSVLFLEF